MSSTEGLREITNEISSLLSDGAIRIIPQHQQNGRLSPSGLSHNNIIPTLTYPSLNTNSSSGNSTPETPKPSKVFSTSEQSLHLASQKPNVFSTPLDSEREVSTAYYLPGRTNPRVNWESSGPHLVKAISGDGNRESETSRYMRSNVTNSISSFSTLPTTSTNDRSSPATAPSLCVVTSPTNHTAHVPPIPTSSRYSPQIQADSSPKLSSNISYPKTSTGTTDYQVSTKSEFDGPHTAIGRPMFSPNGGSGISSNVSSVSHSAFSSSSNLQLLGTDHETEYGNLTRPMVSRQFDVDDLERQVKSHAQAIDILVNEKTVMESEMSTLKAQLIAKTNEVANIESQLKGVRSNVKENQRERSTLSDELKRSSEALTESRSGYRKSCDNVERLRGLLEDQQQENTELISKITSQSAEVACLQASNTELQSKLNMAELLTQQLSSGSITETTHPQTDPAIADRMKEIETEAGRLRSKIRQVSSKRDQAISDLTALRESLVQQQEDNAQKIAELQSKLADSEVMVASLHDELNNLRSENDALKQQVTTEHAQMEQTNQSAMKALEHEKDSLNTQLKERVQDNAQLSRLNCDYENRISELELEMSRVKEQSVDQNSLLTTIAQDKEAVSRAMAQNKELKANLVELQDAFVRLSQQNMELASELETARLRVAQLKSHSPTPRDIQQDSNGQDGNTPSLSAVVDEGLDKRLEKESEDIVDGIRSEVKIDGINSKDNYRHELEKISLEKDSLQVQLDQLQSDYSIISEEHRSALHQLDVLSKVQETQLQDTAIQNEQQQGLSLDPLPEVDFHNMSADDLTMVQTNFNALQQKFVNLMEEKVQLLDKLQENDHLIVQLSHETDTIGDYVTLYQAQRDALKTKFKEKDNFIEQLVQEKSFMERKLRELQSLVRQVLTDRTVHPAHHPAHHPPHHPASTVSSVGHSSEARYTSSPFRSPTASHLPFHLQPQINIQDKLTARDEGDQGFNKEPIVNPLERLKSDLGNSLDMFELDRSHMSLDDSHVTKDISHMSFGESQVTIEGDSLVSMATTEQILHLLDELESDMLDNSKSIQVPCQLCVGPVIFV